MEVAETIPALFEYFARRIPDRLAVKTRTFHLTFETLNQAANRVAHAILAQSQGDDRPILLLLERGAWLSIALLGVAKTGRPYVPLNPSHPLTRTTYILKDSQAHLMLTNNRNLSLTRELVGHRLSVINVDAMPASLPSDNPGLSISPDGISSITYTSGSTGQPKGVMQSHRSTLHRRMAARRFHIGEDDRVAAVGSAGTDNFRALLNGAGSFPWNVKEEGLADLATWLKQEAITVYHSVPSVFRDFVATLTPKDNFTHLRLIILRGETLYRKDVESYKAHFPPHCLLVNEFGSTETRTIAQYVIDHDTRVTDTIVPVGRVLQDKTVLLLDEKRREVAPGQVGEITVKSRYLSPGYWRQPDLTAAKFLPDPDGGDERIYLTGDLGRWLPDGCLVHLGRKDFQVKIRAQRIELAEVEAALRHLDNIREAVVVAREDQPGDKRLVAYIVAAAQPAPSISALRRALAHTLPDYMIPAAFVRMDALPLTPSSKVDRRHLPPPGLERPDLETPFAAPRTPVEALLVDIWKESLRLDDVGIHDPFLELGGNSLLATHVISRVLRTFRVALPLRSLFEAPTVADMALVITRSLIQKVDRRDLDPLLAELEAYSRMGTSET